MRRHMTGFAVIPSPILSLAPAVVRRPSSAVCFTVTLSLALVSATFGQVTNPAASLPGIGQGNAPAPAALAPMPALTDLSRRSALAKGDEAKDGWWISETIAHSRKDQPVFFGVRLANAPQAALAETYSQFLTAGETLAVRLWGCNDLPKEFKGRVQVALKQGDKQFAREDKTVRLAPESVKRLAKYSFDTEDLAVGQYALVTSLFDNAGELVQQQVTTITVRVTQKQDLSRRSALAKAEAKKQATAAAAKKAELKVKADAEKQAAAEAKAQAKAAEKAKKEAELKAKVEAEKQAAEAEAAKKAADKKMFEDTKAKYLAQEKSVIAVKAAALAMQETEYQAKVTQSEADQQAAESQATALALEAKTAQAEVAAKKAVETRAKQVAKQDAPKDVKAQRAVEAKAAEEARERARVAAKAKARQADAAKRIVEDKAEVASDAKAALVKQRKNMTEQNTAMKAQAVKNAERQAKDEIKANQVAAKAKQDAELKAKADLSRRSALAKAEAKKQAAEAEAAKKAADQKMFEDTKAKCLAQEKAVIAVKAAALAMQETEYQAKVTQAEADQQIAESQATALALEAKTAQAEVAAKEAAETRAKQVAKQDAIKDVKAKRAAEAKAAEKAREQASVVAKAKAKQADAAKRIAEDKAEVTSDAKAVLVKQRKNMAKQNTKMETQAVKNAERQAKEEIKANEVIAKARHDAEIKAKVEAEKQAAADLKAKQAEEAKVAREAKVKARIEARSEVTATGRPATEAQAVAGKPVAVTSKDLEKEKWRVAVGMLYRQIGAQRFKTGSYSANYVGKKSSHDHWVGPAGGLNDAGNRIYDDGYVGSDDYTDLDDGTWNWGYDNGRQVNGNTIEFTGVDEIWRNYSRQTTVTEAESSDNADYRGGLMLEADRYFAQTRFVDYGVNFGLARAQTFQASANGMNNFNDYQEWTTYNSRVLDTYDITGLGITPDSAPYNGNATDEGPVIDTSPMTRQWLGNELVSAGSYRAFNSISESLDMDLSTLSLGMSIKGNYLRVYVVGSTGPTLNMLEKDATYEETLYESNNGGSPQVLKYWSDNSSGTECLFGYYVQAEVGVRIYRELHLGIFGRYDWLENVSGNVGPSRYEVNPSGGSMGGTVGLHF
ncbi:MAG: hypothetical protein ABIJ53_03905 [Verrucomicrobiota bacterium]